MTVGQLKTLLASMPEDTRLTVRVIGSLAEDSIENDDWAWFPAEKRLELQIEGADWK